MHLKHQSHDTMVSYRSVRGQRQRPHRSLQLLLIGCRVATATSGDRPDLNVKFLGFLVIEVRVTGVKIAVLDLSSTT